MEFDTRSAIVESFLYQKVYTEVFGVFGGEPYSTIVANYEFDHNAEDIRLMDHLMQVGALVHAPVIAAASPKMFGLESFAELPRLSDLGAVFEGPQYSKWRSLRESEDSCYLGLTMPRFLLRLPHNSAENPIKVFDYNESIEQHHDRYCWGNTAFAMATRINESFANYGWCPNIVGPRGGGAIDELPLHQYENKGQIEAKIPTEVLISDRHEFELAEAGFIPLTYRKGSDNAAFFSANSVQKIRLFGSSPRGKKAQTDFKLGTQLPYKYIVNRLAHYIKVLHRENIGKTMSCEDIQNELDMWLRQYVADQDGASANVRTRRPLRSASISVDDVEGESNYYRFSLSISPNFIPMEGDFTLSTVGKLDK